MAGAAVFATSRWILVLLWFATVGLMATFIRDYTRVEPEYQKLRFEWARIRTDLAEPPDVLLLNQFPNFVRMVRFEPAAAMKPARLQWRREIVSLYPSPTGFHKLATALAL